MNKVAVIVFAASETHADMGRMTNALEIVKEFSQAGDEAKLIFDGAGTEWAAKITQPDHPLHKLYTQVEDHVAGVCKYCSKAFGVREAIEEAGLPLLGDFEQHPSVRSYVNDGYEIITL